MFDNRHDNNDWWSNLEAKSRKQDARTTGWFAGLGRKAHFLQHGKPLCRAKLDLTIFGWRISADELIVGVRGRLDLDQCWSVIANVLGEEKRMYEACQGCLTKYQDHHANLKVTTIEELGRDDRPRLPSAS